MVRCCYSVTIISYADSFIVYMHQEEPGRTSPVESVAHNEHGGGELLEVFVHSFLSPWTEFLQSCRSTFPRVGPLMSSTTITLVIAVSSHSVLMLLQPLSPALSLNPHEEEVPPPHTSDAVPQPLDALPISLPDASLEANPNMAKSPQGIYVLRRLLLTWIGKSNKGPASHQPGRVPRQSGGAADHQSRSRSPARVEDLNAGPSTIAGARPKRVSAALIGDEM